MRGRTGRRHRERRKQNREFVKNRKEYLRFNIMCPENQNLRPRQ
jgi:hypothetical protein